MSDWSEWASGEEVLKATGATVGEVRAAVRGEEPVPGFEIERREVHGRKFFRRPFRYEYRYRRTVCDVPAGEEE